MTKISTKQRLTHLWRRIRAAVADCALRVDRFVELQRSWCDTMQRTDQRENDGTYPYDGCLPERGSNQVLWARRQSRGQLERDPKKRTEEGGQVAGLRSSLAVLYKRQCSQSR